VTSESSAVAREGRDIQAIIGENLFHVRTVENTTLPLYKQAITRRRGKRWNGSAGPRTVRAGKASTQDQEPALIRPPAIGKKLAKWFSRGFGHFRAAVED
jgi:hypothetical protein